MTQNLKISDPLYGTTTQMDSFLQTPQIKLDGVRGVLAPNVLARTYYDYADQNISNVTDTRSRIYLNNDVLPQESLSRQKGVFMHEVGHALGLAHPREVLSGSIDFLSIMDTGATFNIQEADRYNIEQRYQ